MNHKNQIKFQSINVDDSSIVISSSILFSTWIKDRNDQTTSLTSLELIRSLFVCVRESHDCDWQICPKIERFGDDRMHNKSKFNEKYAG